MLKNYLIISVRILLRNKLTSFINIFGLAAGMATFLIIAIYLSYETSYDDAIENKERIYRYTTQWIDPSGSPGAVNFATPDVKRRLSGYSEIKAIARVNHHPSASVPSGMVAYHKDDTGERLSFEEYGIYKAEQAFLDMFKFPFVYGDPSTALEDIYKVAISESTAIKYFGKCSEDIIGTTLYIDQHHDAIQNTFTIAGIFKDIPQNSHFNFDLLLSYSTFSKILPEKFEESAINPKFHCYLEISAQEKSPELERKLQYTMDSLMALRNEISIDEYTSSSGALMYNKVSLQPVSSVYLSESSRYDMKNHGNATNLRLLGGIALIILAIAWINYINLSLIQLSKRSKESGIRKVIGANRIGMIKQFLMEAFTANVTATMVSITIITLALPVLSEFIDKPLKISLWIDGEPNLHLFLLILGVIFLFGTLITGIYPAVVFSRTSPTAILKGGSYNTLSVTTGRITLRNAFIFIQFSSVYVLIALTIGFYYQLDYIRTSELGFDGTQSLVIRTPMKDKADFDKIKYLKNELASENFVQGVSTSSSVPGKRITWSTRLHSSTYDSIWSSARFLSADENFLNLYNIKLIAGRNFGKNDERDRFSALINKTVLDRLGITNPKDVLGEEVLIGTRDLNDPYAFRRIIGVIDDYQHTSPKEKERPLTIIQEGGYLTWIKNGERVKRWSFHNYDRSFLSLKLDGGSIQQNVKQIEQKWKEVFPGYAFDYFFQDEMYNRQYQADLKFGMIFLVFTVISIGLACLGFLGVCLFLINRRTKEIGIRKILGASIPNLFGLMTHRLLGLISLAGLFGIPIAWHLLNRLLQDFAHRIELSWWLFVVPLYLILLIALSTIGFNTLQKARTNPVNSLRYE